MEMGRDVILSNLTFIKANLKSAIQIKFNLIFDFTSFEPVKSLSIIKED